MPDTGFGRPELSRAWVESSSAISIQQSDGICRQNATFELHLIQNKEIKSERPIMSSTKCQRMSFYRAFTASANKTEILCRHNSQFNRFLWLYTLNSIFKSLPHTFVQIFLAAYVPEEHIFLSKMVPFCIGFNFLLIIASFFEIMTNIDNLILLFHYFINGLLYKNPWNRCRNSTYFDHGINETIHCYELEEFVDRFVNTTYNYSGYVYKTDNESFQVAQVEFYRLCLGEQFYVRDLAYFSLLWSVMGALTFYVTRASFWKVNRYITTLVVTIIIIIFHNTQIFHFCHWSTIAVDASTFLYLIATHTTYKLERQIDAHDHMNKYWLGDLDMLAESTTAPPVTHVLTARSTQRIDPSADSTAIVLSNAVYYMLRDLLTDKMTNYCEWVVKAPIYHHSHNFFYLWPMFYSCFYFGDIFSLIFLAVNFFTEILTVTVAFRCLIDTLLYEWRQLKPIIIMLGMFASAVLVHGYTVHQSRMILHLFAKSIATLCETSFLYLMYPLGRLLDDYTFHYGVSPTRLRKLSLQIVPFYYLIKFIMLMKTIFEMSAHPYTGITSSHYKWSWSLIVAPLVMGMIFTVYKHIIIRKSRWSNIFRPVPKWGPKDFAERQLRKQYDSRFYIRSNVSRLLSRYLIAKAEFNVYKLDVRYDFYRRSTALGREIRFKDDKSNEIEDMKTVTEEIKETKD